LGALPTGETPTEFNLGDFGIAGAGLSALAGREQVPVMAILQNLVQGSNAWGGASDGLFSGLFPDGATPFPVLFLSAIMEQILQFVPGSDQVIDLLVDLGSFFGELWDVLSGGTASGSFNVIDSIHDFLTNLPIIGPLLENLELLIFGAEDTEFPLTFPHGFSVPPNIITQFFWIIRKFTGIDDFDDLFSPTLPFDIIFNFIETLLKPQELLAWLVDGILPDGQAPQLIHDIIDAMVKGFAGIPIIGPVVQSVWNVINNLFGIGDNAQITGTHNTGEIAAIKAGLAGAGSGGVSITEDFDRSVATSLGASWIQTYSGAGAGTEGLDGQGNAHWSNSGGTSRSVVNMNTTELTSNTQYASFVLRSKMVDAGGFPQAKRSLILRSNTAGTSYVKAELTSSTTATLSAVVGGSVVASVNATGLVTKAGDLWEFFAGDATDDYHFWAKLNGVTVLNLVDGGHLSALDDTPGTGNLKVGFGGTAGVVVNLFIFLVQYSPPDVAAFGAADSTG
jgi:hypothetical protein